MNNAVKKHVEATIRSLDKAIRVQQSQRANPVTLKYLMDAKDLLLKADSDGRFVLR